jgi:hypothetical protein
MISQIQVRFFVDSPFIGFAVDCFTDRLLGFDTVQELIDLGDFETYFRQELPKLVRSDLEVEASREQRALDDILLSQTVQTVQRFHDLVLSSYRDSWPRRQIPSIPVTAPPKSLAETYIDQSNTRIELKAGGTRGSDASQLSLEEFFS